MAATIGGMMQLVLDIFADGDTPPLPAASPRRRSVRPSPRLPRDSGAPSAQDTFPLLTAEPLAPTQTPEPDAVAARLPVAESSAPSGAPELSLGAVLHAVAFNHPQANAQVHLGDAVVGYHLRRARRRTIGFSVSAPGLVVHAPNWVTRAQVAEALQDKSAWIVRKLREARERHLRMESSRIDWRHGAVLPFLGQSLAVVLDPRHDFAAAGAVLRDVAAPDADAPRATLHLALPRHATPDQIRDAVQAWLMRQARRIFTERLDHFAPQLGVHWKKLTLSSAGTRWGSARSDGSIRLHWRLVHFRMEVIDYVVAHELSHLRVMDHSPRFWDTVATVVPDYVHLRGQLREDALPVWS